MGVKRATEAEKFIYSYDPKAEKYEPFIYLIRYPYEIEFKNRKECAISSIYRPTGDIFISAKILKVEMDYKTLVITLDLIPPESD